MRILKFGGSSLAGAEPIRAAVDIVRAASQRGPLAVVVSAMGGITDSLEKAARTATTGGEVYQQACDEIEALHLRAIDVLSAGDDRKALRAQAEAQTAELRGLLHGVSLVRECTPRTRDQIRSYGERLSALMMAAALRHAGVAASSCDARKLIVTDRGFGAARVDVAESGKRITDHFRAVSDTQVITGFIAASREGETTTLGRGGSDLTAALVGAALDVEAVEIWTDVDGVMSADPRLVDAAFSLDKITYDELMELSHFGAKVVYPPTVHPARAQSIPLLIRNTFRPEFPGTEVVAATVPRRFPICGISSINHVVLMRLEGDGMLGVPGTASRLFGALARQAINVILITQASSEHSICFAVMPEDAATAREQVEEEFLLERGAGLIDDLVVEDELAVVAAVGAEMRSRAGIAGRLFSVLGEHSVNIRAIAQGSSELNISVVIERKEEARALCAIHGAFFAGAPAATPALSPAAGAVAATPGGLAEMSLFLAGTGRVGGTLLSQVQAHAEQVEERQHLRLRLGGVVNSRHMVLAEDGESLPWKPPAAGDAAPAVLATFMDFILAAPGRRLLVDCTASDQVPEFYLPLLRAGVHVVTANKRPLTASHADYCRLLGAQRPGRGRLYYETTVGAGLPVIHALRGLVVTGDRVERVEGTLSGTMAFLLDRLGAGERFSEAVAEAHREGYTEPDPRQDLGGLDVARKLLILAREMGWTLDLAEIQVESLLPPTFAAMNTEQFWSALPILDRPYQDRLENCNREGKVLCYLASLEEGRGRVALLAIDPAHPCAGVRGTDNLVLFHSSRYSKTPMMVRGPGAGPEVTAAGVFAEVLAASEAGA